MKILILANPGDEVMFNCGKDYDLIYFVFLYNPLKPKLGDARFKVFSEHPFKDKIRYLAMVESNYDKDKSKINDYKTNFNDLVRHLRWIANKGIEFWTHNAWGEYGNEDNILVHQAVMEIAEKFDLPVYCYNGIKSIDKNGKKELFDKELFDKVTELYNKHKIRIYNYKLPDMLKYYQAR